MFPLTLMFCFYFVQLSSAFHGTGGLFGFVFGYQRLCFCRCGVAQRQISDNVRSGRLLGGETIAPHQYPWLVIVNTGTQAVGGTLISDRHVVTAASPVYGIPASRISVTLGAHDRCGIGGDPALNSSVAAIVLHPGYSTTNRNNDIALLRLRHVVAFSQFISPICMPIQGIPESGMVAWTTAWTEDSSSSSCTPRVATHPMLPSRLCTGPANSYPVTRDKGCLGPLGARSSVCKTDVGAPVMSRWSSGGVFRLVGIISDASCNSSASPLYTRVGDHVGWLYNHIRTDCQCF